MLLLIGGRDPAPYAAALREDLAGFTAQLLHAGKLTGCLAAPPPDADGRRWLFSFLNSLKRAGGRGVGALLRASALSQEDLADCDRAGLDEAVILQDSDDAASAVELLLGYVGRHPSTRLRLRVWLDPDAGGRLQSCVRAWEQLGPRLLGVELSPFSWERQSNGSGSRDGNGNGERPLKCEWFNAAMTVDYSGTVVPCPQHDPREGLPLSENTVARVMAEVNAWAGRLGSHPVCRSCHSQARFSVPSWMKTEAGSAPGAVPSGAGAEYVDYIRRDVGSVAEDERELLLAEFLQRVSASQGGEDAGNHV